MTFRILSAAVAIVAGGAVMIVAGCNSDDTTDYEPQVRERAAAELRCDPAAIEITPIADKHGTHTFVCNGCGCMATYICNYHDYDSCQREPALEPVDASCK